MQDGGARAGARHEAAARAARPTSFFCLAAEPLYGTPRGGTFGFKFSSRPHPRKFGVKRFLVVREVAGAVSGVACFVATSLEKIIGGAGREARPRSSRTAQVDGCSSLPCRGVLSFR
jgi:hypothetical protein